MTELLHQNIISLFGLARASVGVKNELLGKLIDLVEKRVLISILDRLNPETQEEFLRIMDIGTDEEKTVFLQKHVPDLARLVDLEVMRVKQEAQQFHARFAGVGV